MYIFLIHTVNLFNLSNISIGDTSASMVECHKQNSVIMVGVHSIYRFASSHRMLISFLLLTAHSILKGREENDLSWMDGWVDRSFGLS